MVPVHKRLGKDAPLFRRYLEELAGFLLGRGKRLLTEDMLAHLQTLHDPPCMQAVGQADIDAVHVGVLEKRLVAPVGSGKLVLAGEPLSTFPLSAGDRLDPVEGRALEPWYHFLSDPTGGQDSPGQRLRGRGWHVWTGYDQSLVMPGFTRILPSLRFFVSSMASTSLSSGCLLVIASDMSILPDAISAMTFGKSQDPQ